MLSEVGGEGELDEDGQELQTSSYGISTRDVMYPMSNTINTALLYMKVKKVNPKSSHHKEKII